MMILLRKYRNSRTWPTVTPQIQRLCGETHILAIQPVTMHIKIYFNDKPLFLADAVTEELEPYRHHDDTVFMEELSSPAVNSMIHEMKAQQIHAGLMVYPDLEAMKHAFFKKFILIKTGGGLVHDENGDYLLIFRRGKWDLPKGKMDPGETIENCALREINEETGLKNLSIERHLVNTYHTYDENGKHILKENWWYLVKAEGQQLITPQTEEDITEVKWVKANEIAAYMENSMPSIIDVMKSASLLPFKNEEV
ncbi:MAG: NUDIX domain-containing protein [Chitinophagaceae bacterium]|nr:MAG: NUDIX domain-containing protein [Chitinophagaceae bacterium]